MLKELKDAQYARLSTQPPTTLTDTPLRACNREVDLAEQITGELVKQVVELGAKPADLISSGPIHHALGLNDDDYDVLREFMFV